MKKTIQRIMAFALCLMMCVFLLPMEARAAGDVAINETNFPDPVFRDYVKTEFDVNGNGSLSAKEITAVTEIYLWKKGIKDLTGIERFTKLSHLDCSYNQLTSLNVSQNTALTYLDCGCNPLSALDVSKNTGLTDLWCYSDQLTSLDVSRNTALVFLQCNANDLRALDVTNNRKLRELVTECNPLGSLDVSKNTELDYLDCFGNDLQVLDVSNNPKLYELSCYGNDLKKLDVSRNPALEILICDYNQLTELDVTKNPRLKWLRCFENPIGQLDVRNTPGLNRAVTRGTKRGLQDDYGPDNGIEYVLNADGTEYLLQVDPSISVISEMMDPPAITRQPKSKEIAAGKTVEFTVAASGKYLLYQWYCQKKWSSEWEIMSGQTGATLSLTADKGKNGNKYRCEIDNGGGKTVSAAAKLTVVTKPKISSQPKSATVKAGKKVVFKVKATGGSLKYQWYRLKPGTKKWTKISKATKATYSFKAAKKWNGYKYKCLVKNEAGKTYTKAVKLTVKKK